jgi:hypothetical protein
MLGRGALAKLGLVEECARYLGLIKTTPSEGRDSDALWIETLEALAYESRTAAEGDRRTTSRMKQWLNYAHKRRAVTWFDRVKGASSSRDLMVLARAAAEASRSDRIAA